MEREILFDNNEQKEATERVLAAVRIKTINHELDELMAEVIKYSGNIDKILERNDLSPRYLERLGVLDDMPLIELDEDLFEIDFRVKEVIEDLIKRINTRVNLIQNNKVLIAELQDTYKINEDTIASDIELAKLDIANFEQLIEA